VTAFGRRVILIIADIGPMEHIAPPPPKTPPARKELIVDCGHRRAGSMAQS
jgi:hypothetical protein